MARLKQGSRIGSYAYRIIRALDSGKGNMSDIYLASVGGARPEEGGKVVVIKMQRVQEQHLEFYEDTIYNEADRLRQLDHPNIV
ncbi:MAG: hypothetical protein KDD83_28485, partial [Caldilineaceae bacterium]|nr:hypothetical protein [Caldilineaceae bacterium]